MQDSLFTKIIKGEVPCYKVYEDAHTFAFLDIHPKSTGHTLVVPKTQVEFVWDLPDEDYRALMATVKVVAARLKEVLNPNYVGMAVEGLEVPHAHVHVFPFADEADYNRRADVHHEPDHAALAAMAERLRVEEQQ